MMDRRQPIPVWWLVYGRRLGISDARICESFEPPLERAELEAAWDLSPATLRRGRAGAKAAAETLIRHGPLVCEREF